ncbi:MAG: hypothetical protein ACFCUR_10375 [Rhodomicrobiaceae bacterium]
MFTLAIRSTICLLTAGLIAGCASSGPQLSVSEKSFLGGIGSYDKNQDGVVTCDEWRAAAAELFARADKSNAGALSESDYASLGAVDRTFLVTPFNYFDADGDGKITKAEFVERPNPAFVHADKDKDCQLTALELQTARNLSAPATRPDRRAIATNPVADSNRGPGSGGSTGGY